MLLQWLHDTRWVRSDSDELADLCVSLRSWLAGHDHMILSNSWLLSQRMTRFPDAGAVTEGVERKRGYCKCESLGQREALPRVSRFDFVIDRTFPAQHSGDVMKVVLCFSQATIAWLCDYQTCLLLMCLPSCFWVCMGSSVVCTTACMYRVGVIPTLGSLKLIPGASNG